MAIKRYDVEAFMVDLRDFLKENLNNKLLEIDTEKNDGIVLAPIAQEAYFFQSFNNKSTNYNPIVFYGISSVSTTGIGPNTSRNYSVDVAVIFADHGDDLYPVERCLRYQRALEDLINKNFATMKNSVKLKIQSLVPVNLTLPNSSENFRAIGITIEFLIAG